MKKLDPINLEGLIKACQSRDEGRNQDCWPIVSFGWKDADLEPCGCTGIKSLSILPTWKINVNIGGHTTVGNPMEWWIDLPEERLAYYQEIVQELVFGSELAGEWDGSDWIMFFDDTVEVNPVRFLDKERGVYAVHYPKSAEKVIKAARKACEQQFSQFSRHLHKLVNEVYKCAEEEEKKNAANN